MKAIPAILALLLCAPAGLAITPADMQRAQQLCASKDLAGSIKLFDTAIKANPAEGTWHYMKANCLVKVKRFSEAISEYSLAERLAPRSEIGRYSWQARLNIDSMLSDQAKQAGTPAVADSKSLPPGTLELIRKQAELARGRALSIGEAEAQGELQKANNQAQSLQERAERAASRGASGHEPVALSPQDLEVIRNQSAANADRLKALGKLKAAIAEQESQDKAAEIQRQADSLQDQLVNDRPHLNREIKLNPVGTNLYIRNYSSVPRPPLIPLHAPPAQSISGDTDAVLGTGEVNGKLSSQSANGNATTPSASGSGTRASTSVKGQVIRK